MSLDARAALRDPREGGHQDHVRHRQREPEILAGVERRHFVHAQGLGSGIEDLDRQVREDKKVDGAQGEDHGPDPEEQAQALRGDGDAIIARHVIDGRPAGDAGGAGRFALAARRRARTWGERRRRG